MNRNDCNFNSLFTKGNFSALLDIYEIKGVSGENRKWIVGALCFQGKISDAHELARIKPSPEEMFFLCISHTRLGEYEAAKKILKNLRPHLFFYYQASSFYAYFYCRFRIGLRLAQKAYLASLKQELLIWKVFALDLVGHNLVHSGDIHRGIDFLKEAMRLAKNLGNTGFVQATEISIISYESQFTSSPENQKEKLKNALKGLARTDNFSEGTLLIHLVHLELLTGNLKEAQLALNQAQKVVFGKNLSRHKGGWHFEKAYYHFLMGDKFLSLEELAQAKKCIRSAVERKMFLKILGLEYKILKLLGEDISGHRQKISELSQLIGDPSTLNKLARMNSERPVQTQDPLQSLFDEFNGTNWALSIFKIVQNGYFGILRERILVSDSLVMIKGLWINGLIFMSPDEIHFVQKNVGSLPLSGLTLLFENERLSKEELVNLLWGYDYDPSRHDSILYALIHRIRSILGPFSRLLVGSDHYYRIEGVKKVTDLTGKEAKRVNPPRPVNGPVHSQLVWNIRQYQVLDLMREGRFFSVSEYARHFGITTMTSLRDLRLLLEHNLLLKVGNGRATKYGIFKE